MVYRYLFPPGGGGWVRRCMNFQRQIFKLSWETPDVYPLGPLTLFDFDRTDDAADVFKTTSLSSRKKSSLYSRARQQDSWRISDDRVIGGYSESFSHLIRPSPPDDDDASESRRIQQEPPPLKEEESTHDTVEDDVNSSMESEANSSTDDPTTTSSSTQPTFQAKRPFLRWYGNLDTTVGLESKVQRSGFAALRSPYFHLGGANLRGAFTALEVTCRTDGRVYTINLQVTTSMPNDIFQGHIDVPATKSGKWDRLYLPFTEFGFFGPAQRRAVTSRRSQGDGRRRLDEDDDEMTMDKSDDNDNVIRHTRHEHFRRQQSTIKHSLEIGGPAQPEKLRLDDKIIIESIGLTLMDGQDGPFQFDLAQIRAVNFYEGDVWEGVPKKVEPFVRYRV